MNETSEMGEKKTQIINEIKSRKFNSIKAALIKIKTRFINRKKFKLMNIFNQKKNNKYFIEEDHNYDDYMNSNRNDAFS